MRLVLCSLIKPWVALPLALLMAYGFGPWAIHSFRVAWQIHSRKPTDMTLEAAIPAAERGIVYARLRDVNVDCGKHLQGAYGDAFAIVDAQGHAVAMAHLPGCSPTTGRALEGAFVAAPPGMTDAAVEERWGFASVPVPFLDPTARSTTAWVHGAIGLFALALSLAYGGSIAAAVVFQSRRAPWRLRAVGFLLMATVLSSSLLLEDAHFLGRVPSWLVGVVLTMLAALVVEAADRPATVTWLEASSIFGGYA